MQDDRTAGGIVRLSGQLICASAPELDLVRSYLPEHIRLSRAEPGCLSFEVTQTADPMIWQVEESFTNRAAFDAHQARTKASEWGRRSVGIRREFRVSGVFRERRY